VQRHPIFHRSLSVSQFHHRWHKQRDMALFAHNHSNIGRSFGIYLKLFSFFRDAF